MSDYILIDGDMANFLPTFGAAIVVVQPGTLTASGEATLNGTKVCIDGDESSVEVPGCMYMTPVYSIPGTGTLKIDQLAGDQVASRTQSAGKKVLLKGSTFQAKFEVQSPAKMPPPGPGSPIPDAMTSYSGGSGSFISTNTKFKGT